MQKHFLQAMGKIEGLINLWSAPSADMPSLAEQATASCRILVAVSGGVDSMCLADLFLKNFGPERFAIAHCNFRLRAEESDGDQALVSNWAEENGVRFHLASFDTEEYAVKEGVSIEMAARELRYKWFSQLCRDNGYMAVAVAHNANDNAETLLLNLLRGTGLRGLGGMSLISELPYFDAEDTFSSSIAPVLVRPVLECTRKMVEGYAFVHKLAYREDSTNALSDYKRNRIRNEVFPIFEKINPSFVRTLNREIGYFAEAAEIVDDYCESNAVIGLTPDSAADNVLCTIPVEQLLSHKHWRYLLYYMLEPYGFGSSSLSSIEDLLESDRTISGKKFASATHELTVERTDLCIRELAAESPSGQMKTAKDHFPEAIMEVRCPGIYNFNGCRWQVEVVDRTPGMELKQPNGTLIADAEMLPFPFVCRKWRQGDWMVPFGMRGRRKLSDMFSDLKFTSVEKERAVIIVDCKAELAEQQHVAGVLGLRMDDRYKITKTTKKITRITLL